MTRSTAKNKTKKPLQTTLGKAPVCVSSDEIDLSHVQKPIDTSIFGLREVLALFKTATEEVQNYVTYECDIMYECRVCRTIFRSLANFVLHKRKYCQELYSSKKCAVSNQSLGETTVYIVSDEEEKDIEDKEQNENLLNDNMKDKENVAAKTKNKRSLCTILPRLIDKQESALITEECLSDSLSETKSSNNEIKNNVLLQSIRDSKSGVFQSTFVSNDQEFDYMRTEVMEIHNVLENNEAVIGTDGKIVKADEQDSIVRNNLICTQCNETFSTKKTLRCHVKYRHNSSKKIYKCTDCSDTFANTWGVFRHLYKVHRKTPAQVKKLRSQISNNLISRSEDVEVKMNEASGNKTLGMQEKLDLENKQWLNDLESDNDLQICGGCGRKFERKAALNSHSHFCTKRIALCNSIKENSIKRLQEGKGKAPKGAKLGELEEKSVTEVVRRRKPLVAHKILRFDYCKEVVENEVVKPQEVPTEIVAPVEPIEIDAPVESAEIKEENINTDIVIENVTNAEDEVSNHVIDKGVKEEESLTEKGQLEDVVKKPDTIIENDACSVVNKRKINDSDKIISSTKRKCKEWHALHFKSINYVDKEKMTCLPCSKVFKSSKSLMKHMAGHFNWNRYECNRCQYKSYQRSKCENHVEKTHEVKDKDELNSYILRLPHKKTLELSTNFICYVKKCNSATMDVKKQEENNKEVKEEGNKEVKEEGNEELKEEDNKEVKEETLGVSDVSAENKEETKPSSDHPTPEDVEIENPVKSKDSSVRKMIMEVIFGCDLNSSSSTKDEIQEADNTSNTAEPEKNDSKVDADGVEASETATVLPSKDPRPVRNRTATVKEDFLYDMTQILKLKPSKPKGSIDFIRKQKPLKIYSRKTKLNSAPQAKSPNKNFKIIDDINMNTKTIAMSNNNS